ncbi:CaiB/BaiF CoA transferase family protein [Afifella marina]|uniref:Crotonobetainyl-CoA:carnitine CoA-transferase CaiB n=1 Tax=Afifella marina DSM 2698 TaxID=1120955 RepID=A0A1G5P205_AFIMA|nr:CaiB/BaiF CoA-transferase family protein [Afifella marina]MBK1624308.1 CoA transferase [Afifella marina DSM 2698]MBK1628041.1 CoA transferase [Afifella marina]MBK5918235.1 CoA transferase [Afifella marina]RAI19271.1 CoA transferase [Afifella marina DSM 2698]SCZ43209.1 Crotonobetainyl-CoA:carnitine CoA-transferase CaiB [Afifella marina DSM 2698]
MNKPLEGVKVIELARILAGPFAGQVLADLGADVIKIEEPSQGDDTRRWGPPFVVNPEGGSEGAAYFHACNRGKRSIGVDIATPKGQEIVRRLCAEADVLVENFKLGGLKKYGLDAATLRRDFPHLIVCSITGFGQTGPYASRAGYDVMIQGMSGIMSLTGEPDGEPMKMGVAFADIFTGLYSVIAIQAALRSREASGEGTHIDMALFDSMTGVLANQAMNYLVTGNNPQRAGNAHPNIVPYQVFAVSDGHLIIAVGNDRQFRGLCRILGNEEWADDPRFADNAARVANRPELLGLLCPKLASWPRTDLLQRLEASAIPAGPINTLSEVFADPQLRERGMVIEAEMAGGAFTLPGLRTPILFDGAPLAAQSGSPRLNEHGEAILREINMEETASDT